jgi:hypothetical protein
METLDFSRSYLRFRVDLEAQPAITLSHKMPTTVNNVRINIECRCEITDRRDNRRTVYALGAACKTEQVGAPRDLWLEPNADFSLIASAEEFLILKSWQKNDMGVMRNPPTLGVQPERQTGNVAEAWTAFGIDFQDASGRHLDSVESIIEGIRGDRPLISRTAYNDGDYHVVIEHPVKTINYSERENVFQTDTGPILLPDLSAARLSSEHKFIGCFDLAYSAFNAPDWAEFIVNVPTPLSPEISVNHYSRTRRIEGAENMIIEVAE